MVSILLLWSQPLTARYKRRYDKDNRDPCKGSLVGRDADCEKREAEDEEDRRKFFARHDVIIHKLPNYNWRETLIFKSIASV